MYNSQWNTAFIFWGASLDGDRGISHLDLGLYIYTGLYTCLLFLSFSPLPSAVGGLTMISLL